jgi:hypothetical protein
MPPAKGETIAVEYGPKRAVLVVWNKYTVLAPAWYRQKRKKEIKDFFLEYLKTNYYRNTHAKELRQLAYYAPFDPSVTTYFAKFHTKDFNSQMADSRNPLKSKVKRKLRLQ